MCWFGIVTLWIGIYERMNDRPDPYMRSKYTTIGGVYSSRPSVGE